VVPVELADRTMFCFYAAPAEPFLILAVVYVLGALVRRMPYGAVWAGGYVLLVAANLAYFYPIYTGRPLEYTQWLARMWLGSRWY